MKAIFLTATLLAATTSTAQTAETVESATASVQRIEASDTAVDMSIVQYDADAQPSFLVDCGCSCTHAGKEYSVGSIIWVEDEKLYCEESDGRCTWVPTRESEFPAATVTGSTLVGSALPYRYWVAEYDEEMERLHGALQRVYRHGSADIEAFISDYTVEVVVPGPQPGRALLQAKKWARAIRPHEAA